MSMPDNARRYFFHVIIPAGILFIATFLTVFIVEARMYQWTDPDTGTTQLSGKPPAWYRSQQDGPRIFVFDKNRLIDDTAIEVSPAEREELRRQAFLKAEQDRAAAREKARAAEELKASLKQDMADAEEQLPEVPEETPEAAVQQQEAEQPEPDVAAVDDESTLQEMRELIREWEEQRVQEAKRKLEMQQGNPAY